MVNTFKISKKLLIGCILCLLVSALGLMVPVIANATPSPILCAADVNGVYMYIRCEYPNETQGGLVLAGNNGQVASEMEANEEEGEYHIADFTALLNYLPSFDDVSDIHVFYSVDNYELVQDQDVKIYIDHHDGTKEVVEEHFDDFGFCDFWIDKMSVFSVVTKTNPGVEWTGYSPDYEEKYGYITDDYIFRHTRTKGINRTGKSPYTGVEEVANWDVFKYKACKVLDSILG